MGWSPRERSIEKRGIKKRGVRGGGSCVPYCERRGLGISGGSTLYGETFQLLGGEGRGGRVGRRKPQTLCIYVEEKKEKLFLNSVPAADRERTERTTSSLSLSALGLLGLNAGEIGVGDRAFSLMLDLYHQSNRCLGCRRG